MIKNMKKNFRLFEETTTNKCETKWKKGQKYAKKLSKERNQK